ncbi:multidrug effflux MFS transporter [Mucilaginibacter phyllosphaerae]|uniref:Bcr/CflA family efflux MFS transporter n=1 Tax=Mucilaginibacter phyllosphaerae TaxID=1812349 RepID=A0A4Y8AH58_9SPHI|nr:multidrug effflux MFS transporter [Mucilaginibacter phyllosphaerae]MBB3968839.1 DHA1 family bicyclomycin/chloramphenicol resistance-like MFS transporter [Mucilaginibacter phyllosphaerae]TEW67531.1 Bcr/CflA family efflux MFS transporter [Mucilaginibacter phyllosphaerae]GGH13597.1 Bcr/CflA family drug resistance efflux transporter [Mucilaginibacter phyllosphaerae]
MTSQRYFFLILILGSLTALAPFSIDMYLPGFPDIARSLHTSPEKVALSLSSFFIGISAGQLLYGPLLDKYGRKPPLFAGLAVYIAASVGCYFSTGIEMLIAMRFIQAVGGCAASVASITMVRDIFPVKDNAKVFALLILVLGASPMIAPTVGGYVTSAFGWQLIFLILALIAIVITLSVIFFLPESYQPDASYSLKPGPIISSFLVVIKTPQFYTYAISGGIAFSGLFAYISSSPLVFMDVFKVSSQVYGWIFALLSVGFIGSSQLNSLLNKKYKSGQIVNAALIAMVVISALFLVGSMQNILGLAGTIIMIFLVLCCVGIASPNTSALALAPFQKNAGTASALLGAFQMCIGSLVSVGVSLFKSRSSVPMALIMLVASSAALLVLIAGRRNIKGGIQALDAAFAGH